MNDNDNKDDHKKINNTEEQHVRHLLELSSPRRDNKQMPLWASWYTSEVETHSNSLAHSFTSNEKDLFSLNVERLIYKKKVSNHKHDEEAK